MMFQHTRQMHGLDSMEFLNHHQKMAERMLSPSQQQQQTQQQMEAKRPRLDATSAVGGPQTQDGSPYVHLQHNFFPIDPSNSTVVISKSEYESVKQEVLTLKQTLVDFRGSMEAELSQLKKENKSLKEHISKCMCGCKQNNNNTSPHLNYNNNNTANNNNNTNMANHNNDNKSSEDDNNSFEKSMDDEGGITASPNSNRNLVEMVTRENKRLSQSNSELDRQTQLLRAANYRVPPIPSAQTMSFMRELTAYYTVLENNLEAAKTGLPVDQSNPSSSFDTHPIFPNPSTNTSTNNVSIYGNMPEAFDVEKGLQVQLLPSYNVWVNKSKLQLLLKEATSLKEGSQLFVLRRLIPLVFSWEELASSRGQGLNCKSTDDILSKDPLDPTRVLVCKAYMRKFCLETMQAEPTEKSINETFSHQVNYARRKFKRGKLSEVLSPGATTTQDTMTTMQQQQHMQQHHHLQQQQQQQHLPQQDMAAEDPFHHHHHHHHHVQQQQQQQQIQQQQHQQQQQLPQTHQQSCIDNSNNNNNNNNVNQRMN